MSKRIIAIALALVLLTCLLAIPVAAAETTGQYLNLLDFVSANNSGSNSVSFTGSYDMSYWFGDTLGQLSVYAIEITYQYVGSTTLTALSFGSNSLSYKTSAVGDGLVRVRADAGGLLASDFNLSFSSTGTTSLNILSFNCYLVHSSDYSLSGYLESGSLSTYFSPGSFSNLSNTSSSGNVIFRVEIDSWRNYDSITLDGLLQCEAISSIDAVLEDNTSTDEWNIPLTTNYLSNGDTSDSFTSIFNFNVYADLSAIDRTTVPDSTLVFVFSCVPLSTSNSCYLQLDDARGFVFTGDIDTDAKWYQIIYRAIQAGFGNISDGMYDGFTDLGTTIKDGFSSMEAYWETLINNTLEGLAELDVAIMDADHEWWLWWTETYLPLIVNGTPANSDVVNDMQSSADSLGSLGEQMSAGTPDIAVDDVNVDVNSLVSAGGMTSATNLAVVVTSQPLVQSMLLIVISLALVGYVFFGKRG